jgi:hypothetical protein
MARQPLGGLGRLIVRGFTITLRHTTLGRTPLDEWSARRRDLYLTTHNTRDRHPCPRRDSNPQSQQAATDRRLRPRGHWDRLWMNFTVTQFPSHVSSSPFAVSVHTITNLPLFLSMSCSFVLWPVAACPVLLSYGRLLPVLFFCLLAGCCLSCSVV